MIDPLAEPFADQPPAGMVGSDGPLLRLIKDRRVAFLIVGGINTVVGTGWFVVFQLLIGHRFGYMASLVCAHVASVLWAFVLYRRFVFRVRGHVLLDLGRFELVYLTALGINAVALPLLVEVAGLNPIVAQFIITFGTMFISFFGHQGFSFRRRTESADDAMGRAAGSVAPGSSRADQLDRGAES